jgi:uncharacterized protein YecE (DUF72 family)
MLEMDWRIGCSGFHYKDWKGKFYPEKLPQTKWFEFYAKHFNTLELNVTFYRFPRVEYLQNWYKKSLDGFDFTVKAPRLITHYKRFKDCERLLGDFYSCIREGLKEKLGAVLFQLPPQLAYDEETLALIIDSMDTSFTNVVEFRHESWWKQKVYDALAKKHICFCGESYPKLPTDAIVNTGTAYYRFHGVPRLYKSSYRHAALEEVANAIAGSNASKAYVLFNNTWGMAALNNSRYLQQYIADL